MEHGILWWLLLTIMMLNNRDSQDSTSTSSVPAQNQTVDLSSGDGDEDNPNKRRRPQEDSENKFECRFCDMRFPKSQALGGHMNRHRVEREHEEIQKARNLLIAQQHSPPYYAAAQYYSRMDGGSTSVDPTGNFPSTAGSFMTPQLPYYQPQAQSSVQNWPGNQLLPLQQNLDSAHTNLQGTNYLNPTDNTRPYQSLPMLQREIPMHGLQHPQHAPQHAPQQVPRSFVPLNYSDARTLLQCSDPGGGMPQYHFESGQLQHGFHQNHPGGSTLQDVVSPPSANSKQLGQRTQSRTTFMQHAPERLNVQVDQSGNLSTHSSQQGHQATYATNPSAGGLPSLQIQPDPAHFQVPQPFSHSSFDRKHDVGSMLSGLGNAEPVGHGHQAAGSSMFHLSSLEHDQHEFQASAAMDPSNQNVLDTHLEGSAET